MKKILFISMGETFGGIEKLELDIFKNIKNYKIDFLTPVKVFNTENEISLNTSRKNIIGRIKYNYKLFKYLKKNKYDIIHINSSVFLFIFQVSLISKLTKNKIVIAHSHSIPKISNIKRMIISILKPIYKLNITKSLSCSEEAKKSLFLKNTHVIKNGINIDEYKYNEGNRKKYIKDLKLDNKKVYGHIGRFDESKNHEFLIDLFYEIQKDEYNSILLLVGNGPLEENIKNKVKELSIEDKVIFLGYREDIGKILNCIDIFLFPSKYEGFGISVIESIVSGIPTFISENVPIDENISKNLYKINSFDIKTWKNKLKTINCYNRNNSYKELINSEYDINTFIKELDKIYKELIK